MKFKIIMLSYLFLISIVVSVQATDYYISSAGDDENDGLSPETAWQSLGNVNVSTFGSSDNIFFRRGDVFRGQLKQLCCLYLSIKGSQLKKVLFCFFKKSW